MPKTFFYRILTVSWLVFITFSSLFSFSGMARAPRINIPHADKLVHFFFYFILVCFAVLAARDSYKVHFHLKKTLLYAVLFAFFYGILIEVVQYSFTVDRHGDVLDVLANTMGALAGMLFIKRLISKGRSLN